MKYTLKLLFVMFLIGITGCDSKNEASKGDVYNSNLFIINTDEILNESTPGKKTIKHIRDIKDYVEGKAKLTKEYYGENGVKHSEAIYNNSIKTLNLYFKNENEFAINTFHTKLSQIVGAWVKKHPGSIIITKNVAIAFDSNRDISEEIISELNKENITFREISNITVTKPKVEPLKK